MLFFRKKMEFPPRIAEIWQESVAFHGRPCRTLAVGVRACDTALSHLGLDRAVQMRLVCVTESSSCCVDALQVGLRCTTGTKHLLFYRTGRLIFTVYDLQTGNSVRMLCKLDLTGEDIPIRDILTMPEADLFDFEDAHPLTTRVLNKISRACAASTKNVLPRFSGVQDSPDAFRQFDTQNSDLGLPRRPRS